MEIEFLLGTGREAILLKSWQITNLYIVFGKHESLTLKEMG